MTNFDREVGILAYMVMPYCEEGSLQDWLVKYRADKPLEITEVAAFLDQTGDALQHLHNNKIVHRDIKTTNFLVGSLPAPSVLPNLLLADFGFAQFVGVGMSQDDRGTYLYKAPEQWANARPVFETDQYQLAIMTYYLLTFKHPFEGSRDEVRNKHIYDVAPAPSTYRSTIPAELDAVILRALATKPRDRYRRVKDFTDAFGEVSKPRPRKTGLLPYLRPFLPQDFDKTKKTGNAKLTWSIAIIASVLALLLIIASILIFPGIFYPSTVNCNPNIALSPYPQSGNATSNLNPFVNVSGVKESMIDACGNVIGLSGGSTILDTKRAYNDEMQKGATALRNGDTSGALSHFQAVNAADPSNAEAWIYSENLRVLSTTDNYIVVILGVTTGRIGSFRDSLQGAYLAQIAYNQSALQRNLPPLVFIIANTGANPANTTWVAQQILALKKANSHIVGVVGWTISSDSVNANTLLAHQQSEDENVFMLSPSAITKDLSSSLHFFAHYTF